MSAQTHAIIYNRNIYMQIHTDTCIYEQIHAYTYIYIQIHTYTCIYVHIHAYTYHLLHIKGPHSPQRIGHDVRAIQSFSLPFIRSFGARRGPLKTIPIEERPCCTIHPTVGSCQHLQLLRVCILGRMLNTLMQLVLGAVTQLAGLCRVTAIGVTLWLV